MAELSSSDISQIGDTIGGITGAILIFTLKKSVDGFTFVKVDGKRKYT
jgi:hypothetical protein